MAEKKYNVALEKKLIVEAQQMNMNSRRKLHTIYSGLIEGIIRKFGQTEIPQSALRAKSLELLDQYIDSYNPAMGTQPKTWIQSNLQEKLKRYITQHRTSRYTNEAIHFNVSHYQSAREELNQELNRIPTIEEITGRMQVYKPNVTFEDVKFIHDTRKEIIPSSYSIGSSEDDTLTAGDISFLSEDPNDILRETYKKQMALQAINSLPETHRNIFLHSIDIPDSGYPKLSERNIALKFGITRYEVGKIVNQSIQMLQDINKNRGE